jgi:antitoxin (DNA-binding transcriptional repressor) of toxin-antitoxin stability system
METRISVTELARSLSDILTRVKSKGERFIVERNGERVAVLGPAGRGISVDEFAERVGDLELPGDGFADDLEAVQAAQPRETLPEWRS